MEEKQILGTMQKNNNYYKGWDGQIVVTKTSVEILRDGFWSRFSLFLNKEQKKYLKISLLEIESIIFKKSNPFTFTNGYIYISIKGNKHPIQDCWDRYRFIGNKYTVGFTLFKNSQFEACKNMIESKIIAINKKDKNATFILEEHKKSVIKYKFKTLSKEKLSDFYILPQCERCGAKHIVKKENIYYCAYCKSSILLKRKNRNTKT